MPILLIKNPVEYSFILWMNSFPESMHPSDMDRFYTFVRSVARYNGKRWRKYTYFKDQILVRKPLFDQEVIDEFWSLMQHCLAYHKASEMSSGTLIDKPGSHQQSGVLDGEIYFVDITGQEYMVGGINKSEIRKRIDQAIKTETLNDSK